MSEYRQDPLSRRWVIIGSDRAARPNEFVEEPVRRQPVPCPFCAGNEDETPEAVASYSAPGTPNWLVRIVPNKYPAVTTDEALCPKCPPPLGSMSPQDETIAAFGCHEVIIESPRHVASLSELTLAEAELVFRAYRDRIAALKATGQFRYVQIFKNVGPQAGASLEHVHSQLVALPGVPDVVTQELASCREYFAEHHRPLFSNLIERELAAGQRILAQTDHFVAFCPFASRFPYEVCIAPLASQPTFEATQTGELGELSRLAGDVIGRIERTGGHVAYNCVLHTQPFDTSPHDHYHWHIEIIPRLTKVAGFEWGTGCFINPLPPEAAAAHLRSSPVAESRFDRSV
ncbi:MAG: galactose-1-phosphate uridylyltransferase [Planctomycetaceae bacterium]|nr:galactose-1-phosphate uridylyltransferase [Planctomycetaceae bacterium]